MKVLNYFSYDISLQKLKQTEQYFNNNIHNSSRTLRIYRLK